MNITSIQNTNYLFQTQLDTYTVINIESTANGENVLHLKIKGLILDTIHHLSIVDELIKSRISSVDEWEWQKRIRLKMNT